MVYSIRIRGGGHISQPYTIYVRKKTEKGVVKVKVYIAYLGIYCTDY